MTKNELLIALQNELARRDFYSFCQFLFPDFYTKSKPHLKVICNALQKYFESESTKPLLISTPPRAGKSLTVSLFCAWVFGKQNDISIMRTSYSATLAHQLSYHVREFVQLPKYKEFFESVELSNDKTNVSGWNLKTAKQISYFCAGVGGSITGFGSRLSIIDDAYKNWSDATSPLIQDKTINWYNTTYRSRFEHGCKEIIIGTRWTDNDIIKIAEDNYGCYEKLIIPALQNGISFCEEIHSTEFYLKERAVLGEILFEAIYQQNPLEAVGLMFNRKELKYFELPELDINLNFQRNAFIDSATEGDDFFCMVIGYTMNELTYIIDVIFENGNSENSYQKVKILCEKYHLHNIEIETNGAGMVFFNRLKNEIRGTKIHPKNNSTNKHSRIFFQSQYIIDNFVFRKDYSINSEYDLFMINLLSYDKTGKARHDDAPDALAGLSEWIRKPKLKIL